MDQNTSVLPYGNTAFKMVQELARVGRLLRNPFDESGKQAVVEEINSLFQKSSAQREAYERACYRISQLPPTDRTKLFYQGELFVQYMSILRNKQCMMAYLMYRTKKLQELRWELSSETMPTEILECLSPQERRFRDEYNEILREYMTDIDLNLTLNLREVPQEVDIEVMVLQDVGTIVTEDGSVTLQKNTTTVMKRSDAEPLIKMGVLKHIKDSS